MARQERVRKENPHNESANREGVPCSFEELYENVLNELIGLSGAVCTPNEPNMLDRFTILPASLFFNNGSSALVRYTTENTLVSYT